MRITLTLFAALLLGTNALRGADPATNVTFILQLQHADSLYTGVAGDARNIFFMDSVAEPVDTFSFHLPEPTLGYFMIGKDTSTRSGFYIDLGMNQVAVDVTNPKNPVLIKSAINTEYRYWKHQYDSAMSVPFTANAQALYLSGLSLKQVSDSISSLVYQRARKMVRLEFDARNELLNSFLTLEFIRKQLVMERSEPRLAECSKAELRALFDKLNARMKTFPTYMECLRLFDLDPPVLQPKPPVKTD